MSVVFLGDFFLNNLYYVLGEPLLYFFFMTKCHFSFEILRTWLTNFHSFWFHIIETSGELPLLAIYHEVL